MESKLDHFGQTFKIRPNFDQSDILSPHQSLKHQFGSLLGGRELFPRFRRGGGAGTGGGGTGAQTQNKLLDTFVKMTSQEGE